MAEGRRRSFARSDQAAYGVGVFVTSTATLTSVGMAVLFGWKSRHIYLSETLGREMVSLRRVSDRIWDIYFGPIKLAQLDTHEYRLIHLPRRRRTKS